MEEYLQVGIISSTHGIKGEVKVFPTTDDAARFKKLKKVILDDKAGRRELEIEGVKFFKRMVILKFKGLDSIDDVTPYKGKGLLVTRENAVRLRRNEYFIADLIGMRVIDEEEKEVGVLTDVIETGANDVYAVEMTDGGEVLLPAIRQCILDVDIEARLMRVHIMEGLLS